MSINSRIVLVCFLLLIKISRFLELRKLKKLIYHTSGDRFSYCENLMVHDIVQEKAKGPIQGSDSEFKQNNNKNWLF